MGEWLEAEYDSIPETDSWETLPVVAMDGALNAAAAAAIVIAGGTIASAAAELRATTLWTAWAWSLAAVFLWLATLIAAWMREIPVPVAQLLWLATALLSLCPPIAVLGARRPGAGAWNWFVLLPLLAVLGWPALTSWGADVPLPAPQLETPQLVGIGIVLLMGAGNYVGTKFWASACLYAVAICLLIAPLSAAAPEWLPPLGARAAGSCAMGWAAVLAHWQRKRRLSAACPLDQLWEDYRNLFGIVWARRLQDRLNGVAQQQHWPVRVTPAGFHWDAQVPPALRRETTAKVEQSLRWMLRRFVTAEWIDQRLCDRSRKPRY